jgi:hypothetical protein
MKSLREAGIMNVVLADQYVRNQTQSRLAEAEKARIVRQAKGGRRWGHRRSTVQD